MAIFDVGKGFKMTTPNQPTEHAEVLSVEEIEARRQNNHRFHGNCECCALWLVCLPGTESCESCNESESRPAWIHIEDSILASHEALRAQHDALIVEKESGLFWSNICYPEGMGSEEADFRAMLEEVPKVYCSITNGKISKPNTLAACVIAVAEDEQNDLVNEAVKEATDDIQQKHDALKIAAAEAIDFINGVCNQKCKTTDYCLKCRELLIARLRADPAKVDEGSEAKK